MKTSHLIETFAQLGQLLTHPSNEEIEQAIAESVNANPWFTYENTKEAIANIAQNLTKKNLTKWITPYEFQIESNQEPKVIAIVMAGNIPLVGFHDFLSALISGNNVLVKLSSGDRYLLPLIAKLLMSIDDSFYSKITFTTENIQKFDAVIATGSNNTSRYFEYYFNQVPHIIRKNRNSLAILSGNESKEELRGLADDIFMHLSLGCRNVSKLFVPQNYIFDDLLSAVQDYSYLIEHPKFKNNYDYQKAILLMNGVEFYDTGFSIFQENNKLNSPIAVVNFEYYKEIGDVENFVFQNKDQLQCIVSSIADLTIPTVPFGKAQKPELWDYADDINTLDFTCNL